MTRYAKRIWIFAAGLSALAGYVDAIGFIELGGFFVSFMSGNSTRLAVGIAGQLPAVAALAGALVGCFVLGVIAGTLAARLGHRRREPVVLALVALLLAAAATVGGQGAVTLAALLMAAAMGAENAVFEREGEVAIGLTYMTGTLVKLGQRATAALLGGDRFGWLPYLLLWAGLISGATAGALVHPQLGLGALWFAAAAAALLALVATRFDLRRAPTSR